MLTSGQSANIFSGPCRDRSVELTRIVAACLFMCAVDCFSCAHDDSYLAFWPIRTPCSTCANQGTWAFVTSGQPNVTSTQRSPQSSFLLPKTFSHRTYPSLAIISFWLEGIEAWIVSFFVESADSLQRRQKMFSIKRYDSWFSCLTQPDFADPRQIQWPLQPWSWEKLIGHPSLCLYLTFALHQTYHWTRLSFDSTRCTQDLQNG